MSSNLPALHFAAQPVHLPVAIDYPAALALRQMALVQNELPKYLLAPEVSALLHYVPDLHRKLLLATLSNTGARINEALALTRSDFSLVPPWPFVQLATLKQRSEKAARTASRAPAGNPTHRLVPLSDVNYVSQLEMMVATLKIPLERRNKRTGRTEKARIWDIIDRTVRTWISEAVEAAAADAAHVPSLLHHAHAVRRYPVEGAAEPDGTQVGQFNGGVHEGVCARCGGASSRPVPDARGRCGGHTQREHISGYSDPGHSGLVTLHAECRAIMLV